MRERTAAGLVLSKHYRRILYVWKLGLMVD